MVKTKRAYAKELAAMGFYVFPVVANKKIPLIESFTEQATRDPEQIDRWWFDDVLGLEQNHNIGIATSKFGDGEALLVLDIDVNEKKNGFDSLDKIDAGQQMAKEKFCQQKTASGGAHFIFRVPKPLKQSAGKLGKGLDIRSSGGYILGLGSEIDGGTYQMIYREHIRDAPKWLLDACETKKEESKTTDTATEFVSANAKATDYLINHAPLAIEGRGGDETTFKVAARLKDFGVDEAQALELMCEHWNFRCEPQWSIEELKIKIKNAYHYGQNDLGVAAPEAQFTKAIDDSDISYLEKMNKEYAIIYVEGSHFVLHETVDEKGRSKRVFLNEITFKRRFSPFTVQQGKGRAPTQAEIWLDWEGRREYAGVCFSPEKEPKHNYYNLWKGFAVKQTKYEDAKPNAKKGFNRFIEHLKENVCGNNEGYAQWLISYFAHMVQRPYERPLTTLVFRGAKGVGKNALIDRVGRIFGSSHYLVAHDSRYLTSNFNGHLDSCLCLVLDEAFWSGDKSAEGKLKGLTTAPEILIERKGKEPYTVDNFVRLVIIGNEDWLVPASADERRYAVFDVGNSKKQNTQYFHEMRVWMDEDGGSEVLLHYLKNFDLSKTNVNQAPSTEALLEQKISSLDRFHSWWYECLMSEKILGLDFATPWENDVETDRFRDAFRREVIADRKGSWTPSQTDIGKKLRQCAPSIKNIKKRTDEGFIRAYRLPKVEACRKDWEAFVGHAVKWDDSLYN